MKCYLVDWKRSVMLTYFRVAGDSESSFDTDLKLHYEKERFLFLFLLTTRQESIRSADTSLAAAICVFFFSCFVCWSDQCDERDRPIRSSLMLLTSFRILWQWKLGKMTFSWCMRETVCKDWAEDERDDDKKWKIMRESIHSLIWFKMSSLKCIVSGFVSVLSFRSFFSFDTDNIGCIHSNHLSCYTYRALALYLFLTLQSQ